MSHPAGPPALPLMTGSARQALRLAWAFAVTRRRTAVVAGAKVETDDLLVGLCLTRGADSDLDVLLRHFGVRPHDIVPALARPADTELVGAWRRLPEVPFPPCSAEVTKILRAVGQLRGVTRTSLPALTLAFLQSDTRQAKEIDLRLNERGVTIGGLIEGYHGYAMRDPRPELRGELDRWFPPARRRIGVAKYHPDDPGSRWSRGAGTVAPPDLVGIYADVEAFAHLLVAQALRPPLAIGLFGDWGSGKSFFMRRLQRRVDALATAAAAAINAPEGFPRAYEHVVQVEFNAWQYVEGDLFASLVEHLFRNLRARAADEDDLLFQRQQHWLTLVGDVETAQAKAAAQHRSLRDQLATASQALAAAQEERVSALAVLEARRHQAPLSGWGTIATRVVEELKNQARAATDDLGMPALTSSAEELASSLDEARRTLVQAGPLVAAIRTGGWRWTVALVALLAATPLVAWGLDQLGAVSAFVGAVGGVSAGLAALAAYTRRASDFVRRHLATIDAARRRLDAVIDAQRAALDEKVKKAEERVTEIDADVGKALKTQTDLLEQKRKVDEELSAVTPASVMREFLDDRLGSDDYRRHLGVPALVRRDLERLSHLVERQNAMAEEGEADADSEGGGIDAAALRIDRIVLYIDDLDRCPPDVVVRVMQAIHLLLAFPLFVVVVAVDSRWLRTSLRDQMPALVGKEPGQATTRDFLEKIFQVPYQVEPLSTDERRRMLEALLGSALPEPDPMEPDDPASMAGRIGLMLVERAPDTSDTTGGGDVDDRPVEIPEDFSRLLKRFFARTEPPDVGPAALTINDTEFRFLVSLAPLLDDTPRSVKRFTNLYLLLKSIARARQLHPPMVLQAEGDNGYLGFMLAIATRWPESAVALFATIEHASLADAAEALDPELPGRDQIVAWLQNSTLGREMPALFGGWLTIVRQLTFDPLTEPESGL